MEVGESDLDVRLTGKAIFCMTFVRPGRDGALVEAMKDIF